MITITDHGAGFDPDTVDLPDFDECPEGGYGIYIMKTIMDDMRYEKTTDGNNLILTKNWAVRRYASFFHSKDAVSLLCNADPADQL